MDLGAIDYDGRRVTLSGRPVSLMTIEYRLLAELSANAGRARRPTGACWSGSGGRSRARRSSAYWRRAGAYKFIEGSS